MTGAASATCGSDAGPVLDRRTITRYFSPMSRLLILTGLALILLGLLWGPLMRLGLGRLPGDIVIERENFRLYIPVTSAILVSIALSALLFLIRLFLGR